MYGFFFDYQGETIRLPVNPASFTTTVGNKNETVDIVSMGEINILKDIGLRDFSFKILLPGKEYPFVHTIGEFKKPIFYLNKFREYKALKKPVRLVISRELPNKEQLFGGDLLISFEDYTVEENAGEEGDFWVDIKLKEYRAPKTKINLVEGVDSKTGTLKVKEIPQRESKEPAKDYKVKQGDSLWAIAKRELNDGSRYPEIAKLNGIKDPNKIATGQSLKLPK